MKREPGMAYNMKTLNKVFAVLAVLLFIATIWVFIDDYLRPWKAVQIEGMQLEKEVLEQQIQVVNKSLDQTKVQSAKDAIVQAQKELRQKDDEIKAVEKKIKDIDGRLHANTIRKGSLGTQVSALIFHYETEEAHGHSKVAAKLKQELTEKQQKFALINNAGVGLEQEKKAFIQELDSLKASVTQAEKALKDLIVKRDLLVKAKEKATIGPVDLLRNMPLIDYLDPTIKIHQIVVKNAYDDRYFQQVPKVDRCTTCHLFMDNPLFANKEGDPKGFQNPYRSHPKLDLMVGINSPHPMKEVGCTVCHGGEGHRVNDFNAVAHTPNNEKQKKDWIAKYDWKAPHKVPDPMLPLKYIEASCLKCHQGVDRVAQASKLNHGRELIQKYGCHGCHKIEGWEHHAKVGPTLNQFKGKLTKEFTKNWIWDPKSFNPHAKMPSFYSQSNNSKPEFMAKNITEVNAMVEYLWSKSGTYVPFMKYTGGNSAKGKELIAEVGCLGCHQVEGLNNKAHAMQGPYLVNLGSKVNKDWLVSWLKKPSHYYQKTRMPSLRLTDQEASDISAYLLASRNENFEEMKFESLDEKLQDEILLTYMTAFDTKEVAQKKLAQMSSREKTLELGHKSLGKYGCYSCHNIKGFEGAAQIGPELTKVGSKPVEQFGFGHVKIPRTRHDWITHHLENPSQWDLGTVKPFKDLNRMPNFYLTPEEIEAMTTALLGQVEIHIPLAGQKVLAAHEAKTEAGFKVINNYNCMGCHQIDGVGGKILASYDDPNQGPPQLNIEGERVHSEWLYTFFKNVRPIRTPYLKVRMPSYEFTSEETNLIVDYFKNKTQTAVFTPIPKKIKWEPGERQAAVQLFNEFACASCHSAGFTQDVPQAPNLYHAKMRLRSAWIEKWLYDPQKIMPGTVMPNFWFDGVSSAPDILGGDTKKQIRALTKYIMELGKDSYPAPYPKHDPQVSSLN